MRPMTSSVPPMAPQGTPPPMALARHTISGLTPRYPLPPPVGRGDAALDLVEGEQGAMVVHYLAHPLQVALLRRYDAGVHHYRLEDHASYLSMILLEEPLQGIEVVVRDDQGKVGDGPRDTRPRRR